jgi:hypothetical protein
MEIHPEDIRRLGGSVHSLHEMSVDLRFDVRALTPNGLASIRSNSVSQLPLAI